MSVVTRTWARGESSQVKEALLSAHRTIAAGIGLMAINYGCERGDSKTRFDQAWMQQIQVFETLFGAAIVGDMLRELDLPEKPSNCCHAFERMLKQIHFPGDKVAS